MSKIKSADSFVFIIIVTVLSPLFIFLFYELTVFYPSLIITFLGLIISTLAIWLIPKRLLRNLKDKEYSDELSEFERERDFLKLLDDTRKTIAQIIAGFFFVVGLGVTYYTYDLTKQRMLTERYAEATKLLHSSNDSFMRSAGLYELKNISQESASLHPAVMDVLLLFIKNRSKKITKPYTCQIIEGENNSDIILATEIIITRNINNDKKDFQVDLSESMLNKMNFSTSISSNANVAPLSKFNFDKSCLIEANFENAYLANTNFGEASVFGANFKLSDIRGADLRKVYNLSDAQISSAKVNDNTLVKDDLKEAVRKRAAYYKFN